MRHFLAFLLSIITFTLVCQEFSSEVFHEGLAVTTERDTLKGDLKYDMETNILIVIHEGKTMSFSSHKVFYFEIFDTILNRFRRFYSIPYTVNYDYKIPVFFELVYEGKISLIIRERLVNQTVNSSTTYWGGNNSMQVVIKYTFYFLDVKGRITYFSGKKRDLFSFMSKKESDVKKFIKENRLKTDRITDLVRITSFYNSI